MTYVSIIRYCLISLLGICKNVFLWLVNFMTTKDKHTIFFIPHINCKNDSYDIINYHSDNVLCLLNRFLTDSRFSSFHFFILIYQEEKIKEYEQYIKRKCFKGTYSFVLNNKWQDFFNAFRQSSYIFTDHYYYKYLYKTKKQKIICLGYFAAPFKDDYWKIKRLGYHKSIHENITINRCFDYHISPSDFSSRELSVDSLIYLPKFLPLGLPRNDIFFEDNSNIRKELYKALGYSPKYIFTYAPTHRDYENPNRVLSDPSLAHNRTILGNTNEEEERDLVSLLESIDAVIIAKLHPAQAMSILNLYSNRRLICLNELSKNFRINLQELLSVSDVLITDYSTAFYDYLLTGRPIIHYCYDYEVQLKNRGFTYNPIFPFMPGTIVYSFNELCNSLKESIEKKNFDAPKMDYVRSLIYLQPDGHSTDRIVEYFFGKL